MKLLRRIADFIVFGNVLIAVSAASMTGATYLLYHTRINYIVMAVVFAATLFIYSFDRLMILQKIDGTHSERHIWVLKNAQSVLFFTIFSAGILAVLIWYLSWWSILFLAHLALISFAYSIPFLKKKSEAIPLRSVRIVKIFLITYVWVCTTVLFPIIENDLALGTQDILLSSLGRALFIFGITLPFDIRDYETDKQAGVITIPALTGVKYSKLLSLMALVLFTFLSYLHYSCNTGLAMITSGIITLIAVSMTRRSNHEYFYTGLLDATPLLQFLLLVFSGYL